MKTKKCSKCQEIKDIALFSKNSKIKDGHHCSCKECDMKKYYENRERNIEKMREYKKNNPEKMKEYYKNNIDVYKEYREKNKESIKKYFNEYYKNNSEKRKKYLTDNIENIKKTRKNYYNKNREIILEKSKIYTQNNKDKKRQAFRRYRENNLEKESKRVKDYYENNKKNIIAKSVERSLTKRRENPLEKLKHNIRNRTSEYIKRNNIKKINKTFDIIGCTAEELRNFLEEKFDENMSWDNYGKWHIDHKIPLALGKTKEELYKLCHFTNLQPMWASDNIRKGAKLI